ncbi:MAG: hypothetical protein HFE64_00320 [Lachnospiraceae bacterium]|jgi:hypothetical protein|nr:hypothetical protein [Lachnospiraceae bacterium]
MTKKNTVIYIVSLLILCAGFLLCRYVFLELHGMHDWPLVLFIFSLFAIGLAFLLKTKKAPVFISLAYLAGFAAGLVFQTNGVDPGGGHTNNLWLIWTAVLAVASAAALLGELALRRRKGQR